MILPHSRQNGGVFFFCEFLYFNRAQKLRSNSIKKIGAETFNRILRNLLVQAKNKWGGVYK